MASAPQQSSLPLFYRQLEPLSSQTHAKYRISSQNKAGFLAGTNAVPLTVEEFPHAQRYFPIVFSASDEPVPLALMGLNDGVNTFVEDDGKVIDPNFYPPAYIRRYPFLLARLRPDTDELSLCFDPTAEGIGESEEGELLFENGEPTELTKSILKFNEEFEQSGMRTAQFVKELQELDLLMDGETQIQVPNVEQPFIYRGFRMVSEEKLNALRGDQLRKIVQNGMLPLIYAHLFSLSLMRDIFDRQARQGKMPEPQLVG